MMRVAFSPDGRYRGKPRMAQGTVTVYELMGRRERLGWPATVRARAWLFILKSQLARVATTRHIVWDPSLAVSRGGGMTFSSLLGFNNNGSLLASGGGATRESTVGL